MNIPKVSVTVDITNIAGIRLGAKGDTGAINFDVKAKLEEKERKSQTVIVNFSLFLTTKPSVVKFEVKGAATLTGKDVEIDKMLEVDPEIKVPYVFQKVYQNAFAATYLLSTILKAPPPPHNLLPSKREETAAEDVDVESRIRETITKEDVGQKTEEVSNKEGVESRVENAITEGLVEERAEESLITESANSRTGDVTTEKRVEERNKAVSNTES